MPSTPSPSAPSPVQQLGVFAAALLFSLPTVHHFGRLGFHLEDLSIPFDGGYRVLLGQLPFVEFVAPIGPVLFLQQALFFALFGVSLAAFLTHAAVLNAIAGWAVWRMLQPHGAGVAVAGSAVTLAWFYLPPAAPYIDTTAFFWLLMALLALTLARERDLLLPIVLAGVAAGLAFLTKQNIGGLGIAGIGLLLLLHDRRKFKPVLFGLGALLPLALLSVFAMATGGWANYVEYFWQVPLESGRLKYILPWAFRMVIKAVRPEMVNSEYAAMVGPALREVVVYAVAAVLAWRWLRERDLERRFTLALAAMLLLIQQWSFNTSNNDEPLYWPFAGLLLALLWNLFAARVVPAGLALVALLATAGGLWITGSRTIHSVRPASLTFEVEHPRLEGLRFHPQEGADLAALLRFADQQIPPGQGLFVFGYSTYLYGVTGHEPPQPLLWFRPGVSYSATHPETADDRIVQALVQRGVRWIVLDQAGAEELLDDFPGLRRYVEGRFREVEVEFGTYRVFRRVG